MLREVERVLRARGPLVISGFNPASLWGLRQRVARAAGPSAWARPPLPAAGGDFIGYWRLRDWLRLLAFDLEGGPVRLLAAAAEHRALAAAVCDWMDRVGERWWPVLGAAYMLVAVKRVRGMRLVGLAHRQATCARAGAVVAHAGR
jgi:hypothetical protein